MAERSLLTQKFKQVTLVFCTDASAASGKRRADAARTSDHAFFLRNAVMFDPTDAEPCNAVLVMDDVPGRFCEMIDKTYPGKVIKYAPDAVKLEEPTPEREQYLKSIEDAVAVAPDPRAAFKPRMKRRSATAT